MVGVDVYNIRAVYTSDIIGGRGSRPFDLCGNFKNAYDDIAHFAHVVGDFKWKGRIYTRIFAIKCIVSSLYNSDDNIKLYITREFTDIIVKLTLINESYSTEAIKFLPQKCHAFADCFLQSVVEICGITNENIHKYVTDMTINGFWGPSYHNKGEISLEMKARDYAVAAYEKKLALKDSIFEKCKKSKKKKFRQRKLNRKFWELKFAMCLHAYSIF